MSAVKNLRAMFEQKGETSPPDRGRSPGIPPGSESPRPLSKVRADFVAIEKDGRIGLQRGTSQDSNISATRKPSDATESTTPAPKQETRNIFADAMAQATATTSLHNQPIPESPRLPDPEAPGLASPAKITKAPAAEASTGSPRKLRSQAPDAATEKPVHSEAPSASKPVAQHANGVDGDQGKEKANGKHEVSKPSTSTTTKTTPKPLSVPSTSKAAAKSAKSPTVIKAPKSPAETSTHKLPAKTPERISRHAEKVDTPRASAAATTTPRASSVKRPPPLQASPASAGFVKPKPKSPTRPVRLPPSLTSHTAASGSKLNHPRQSHSRASGSSQNAENAGRPPSRGSVSTVATTGTKTAGAKTLKRQSSTINRPRPSLGPPPKQTAKDHPLTKNEKHVDEGFLARMMRPTQASASKVHDKVVTPPRKAAPATTVRKQALATKVEAKAVKKPAPRVAATAGSSTRAAANSSTRKPNATAAIEHTVPAKEQAKSARAVEEPEPSPVSIPADVEEETTAQEIALAVENVATAEEVIKVAKEAEGEAELPEPSQYEVHSEPSVEEEHLDALVEQTEALSLEDSPESEAAEENDDKDDEAKEDSGKEFEMKPDEAKDDIALEKEQAAQEAAVVGEE